MSRKSLRGGWVLLGMLLVLAGLAPPVAAYPEPSIVPRSWQLEFSYARPQPLAVPDLDGAMRWYWYMTYKVTNHTGADRMFIPDFEIITDAGDLFVAGRNIPALAFELIKKREGNDLLESPVQIVGRILQGEDNAREGAIIWPATTHDVNHVSVFAAGLSGETQTVPNPATGQPVLLRKTLMIHYYLPGTRVHPQRQPIVPRGNEWVMR